MVLLITKGILLLISYMMRFIILESSVGQVQDQDPAERIALLEHFLDKVMTQDIYL